MLPKKDDDGDVKGRKRKGQRGAASEEKRSKRREAEDSSTGSKSSRSAAAAAPSRIIPLEATSAETVAPVVASSVSAAASSASSPSFTSTAASSSSTKAKPDAGAIDRNAPEVERLLARGGANVVDLVVISNTLLPEQLPAHFASAYTPVTDAGSPAQIKHLARCGKCTRIMRIRWADTIIYLTNNPILIHYRTLHVMLFIHVTVAAGF